MEDRHIKEITIEISKAIRFAGIAIAMAIYFGMIYQSCMTGFGHH